jgi:hypothetical protein
MACPGKRKEVPEEIEVVVENQEVPNKEATLEMVRALKDQSEDLCQVIRHLKWLTRSVVLALFKGHG